MKFDLQFKNKNNVSKFYTIKNFKPEKYFTRQFIAGEDNDTASRIICTAYLTKLEIAFYSATRFAFKGEFKYVFDNTGKDVATAPFELSIYVNKDFHLEGIFNKKLCYDGIALKNALESKVDYCAIDVIKMHECIKYTEQFGKVPHIESTCNMYLYNIVTANSYDQKLDLITNVALMPVSVSGYMTYYYNKIESNTTRYTEDDLAVYYEYVKKCIAKEASISKELTDYTPYVHVPSFEYFLYQRKLAKKYADDFEKVKELSNQIKPYLTADVQEYFVADLYKIVTEHTTDSPKSEPAKNTSKKSKKAKKDDSKEVQVEKN